MKIFCTICVVMTLLLPQTQGQVAKKVVAELFTNTRCSICAARIPGLKQNLENHPEVLIISTHPSAPYASCVLHQHNPAENDGRTSHYGVYGATPRLVVQGEVIPGSDLSNANIFTNQINQTTPFSLGVREIRKGNDSVEVVVTIHAVSTHAEQTGSLYVAYVEDTLSYNAPNGETEHWGVFRKAFSPVSGANIALPASGDSLSWTSSIAVNDSWVLQNMKVIAVLSNQFNLVLQSESTTALELQAATTLYDQMDLSVRFWPNPVQSILQIQGVEGVWSVTTITGKELRSGRNSARKELVHLDLSDIPAGIYMFQTTSGSLRFIKAE